MARTGRLQRHIEEIDALRRLPAQLVLEDARHAAERRELALVGVQQDYI